MTDGKAKHAWQHTSTLLAMLANLHRDPKKTKPFKPDDFNPTLEKRHTQTIVVDKTNIHLLKRAFVSEKG